MGKKIELTVREIDVAKFEAGSSYLILLDPRYADWVTPDLEKLIERHLNVKALVLVLPEDGMKIYGLPQPTEDTQS